MMEFVAADTWWPVNFCIRSIRQLICQLGDRSISASALKDDDRVNVSVWLPVPQHYPRLVVVKEKEFWDGFCTRRAVGPPEVLPKKTLLGWLFVLGFFVCFPAFGSFDIILALVKLCQSQFATQQATNNYLLFEYLRFISLCLVVYFFIKADLSWTCLLAVSGRYIFFLSFWRQIFL